MDLQISTHMTSRERFLKTMRYEKTDRVPYFEEGIRKDVIKAWRTQGLSKKAELSEMFSTDRREEIEVDLEPRPKLKKWPASRNELNVLRKSLDPVIPADCLGNGPSGSAPGDPATTCSCCGCTAAFSCQWECTAGIGFPK